MIKLSQSSTYDPNYSEPLYVTVSDISAVGHVVLGCRQDGARITLKNGDRFLVWESVDRVMNLIHAFEESSKMPEVTP